MSRWRSLFLVSSLTFLLFGLFTPPTAAQTELEVEEWFDRAQRFVSRGQWSHAVPLLERVLETEPEDEEAAQLCRLAYAAVGNYEALDALTSSWLARSPAPRAWTRARLAFLISVGRDHEALTFARGWVEEHGKDYLLESEIARIHQSRGRDAEAKAIFDGLIDRAKTEVVKKAEDLIGLARAYQIYTHGLKPAEQALVEAQKFDENEVLAYEELGWLYAGMDLPSDMRKEFRDALEKRPRWPDYLYGVARAADLRLGMKEAEKEESIDLALKTNPNHPASLFERGLSQLGDALWDDARASFAKALAVNPRHLDSLSGLAAWAWITHDVDAYAKGEKGVLELDPTYGRLYQIIAQALNERRRWPECVEFMRKAVAIDDRTPALWDDLARYTLYVGHEEEGLAALEKANALSPFGRVWRNNMVKVMDELHRNYATSPTDHYVLKLHKLDDQVLKRYVPAFIERSWDELCARYDFTPEGPILFEVFRDSASFSVRTMGMLGLPALGVCFGTTVSMDSPAARKPGTYNWAGTAHHEIAHVFTLQKSRGRVPRWLTEGLSSWEEVRRNPSWGRDMEIVLHDALENDQIFGVLEFDSGFRGPRIGFAYFQGGLASAWIEQKWGMAKVNEMLIAYGQDKLTPQVLHDVLEVSPQEFDAGFLAWVREMLAPLRRMPNYDETSIARFKTAIAADEDVAENRIKLAWGYFRAGKSFDADAILKQLLDAGVEDPRIDLLFGTRAYLAKRWDVAKERYAKVQAAAFEDHDMAQHLAAMAGQAQDSKAEVEWLEKAAATNPWVIDPRSSPFLQLARLSRGAGDLDKWASWTERYVALVDLALEPRQELIEYYRGQGNTKRVIELLDDLNNVVPLDPALHLLRGEVLAGMDDHAAARIEFEVALDLGLQGRKEFEVRLRLGRVLLELDDGDEAAYHLERALEIDPASAEAQALLEKARKD